ncbi:helix-turn-helix domain-containing protein [Flavobacterium phycosphaerae]|uniref:helix-turn-helix domain-containing protein n=1 Tax=Flavobacterium phycosphaerae TaxID=2697515 RepID=UPI0013894663|nr:helix-turn-helix domain-containing protein [Flavobacterium phycosphaerae]
MDPQIHESRIRALYKMLFEIISGNLAHRVPADTDDEQFNEIAKSLNEFASKLQDANYENPFTTSRKWEASELIEPVALIQKVQEYILTHLDEELPSSKELAQMFGTNEFTLKQSFRNWSKTSIYQFYNDERLKKAHLIIEQTRVPLTKIALLSGFNNYTNFYKAFKKKYGVSPADVKRSTTSETNKDTDSNIE